MGLERCQLDLAPGKVRQPRFQPFARIDPLHIGRDRRVNIAAFQPNAFLKVEAVQIRHSVRRHEVGLRKWQPRLDHQRWQPIAMRVERGLGAVHDADTFAFPLREILQRRAPLAH